MKPLLLSLPGQAVCLLAALMLLSSCAPAPGIAPSVALTEQLQQIRQHQNEQAEQLQLLTQQMNILQQVLGVEPPVDTLQDGAEKPAEMTSFIPRKTVQTELAPAVNAYLAAFSSLANGHPETAESRFERFLQEFPNHQHAPNARFWLAQAQSSQGKNDLATSNLRRIIIDPQARFKAPAAMMQLANIYRQQGLNHQADDIFEQLRVSYPDSPEAQQLIRSDKSQGNSDPVPRQRGNR